MNFQFSPLLPRNPQYHWDRPHTTVLGEEGCWGFGQMSDIFYKNVHCVTMAWRTWKHPGSANARKSAVCYCESVVPSQWNHRPTLCAAKLCSSFSSAFLTYSKASNVSCFFRPASMLGRRDRSRDARASLHRNSASSLEGHTQAPAWVYTDAWDKSMDIIDAVRMDTNVFVCIKRFTLVPRKVNKVTFSMIRRQNRKQINR